MSRPSYQDLYRELMQALDDFCEKHCVHAIAAGSLERRLAAVLAQIAEAFEDSSSLHVELIYKLKAAANALRGN